MATGVTTLAAFDGASPSVFEKEVGNAFIGDIGDIPGVNADKSPPIAVFTGVTLFRFKLMLPGNEVLGEGGTVQEEKAE